MNMGSKPRGPPEKKYQPIKFSKTDIQLLCNEVKQREFIWNPYLPLHQDAQKLKEAWCSISEKVSFPPDVCKKAWNSLFESYRRHQSLFVEKAQSKDYFPDVSFLNRITIKWKSADTASAENPKKRIKTEGSSSDELPSYSSNQSLPQTIRVAGSTGGKLGTPQEQESNNDSATLSKQLIPASMLKQTLPVTLGKHGATDTASAEYPKKRIKTQGSCIRNLSFPQNVALRVAGSTGVKVVTPQAKESSNTDSATPPKQLIPASMLKKAVPVTLVNHGATVSMLNQVKIQFVPVRAQKPAAPVDTQKQTAITAIQKQPSAGEHTLNTLAATPKQRSSQSASPKLLNNLATPATPKTCDEPKNAANSEHAWFESSIKDEPVEESPLAFTQKKFTLESLLVPHDTPCSTLNNKSALKSELEPNSADYLEVRRPTISAVPTALLLEKPYLPTAESSSIDSPSMDIRREHDLGFNSIYTPPAREVLNEAAQEVQSTTRDDSETDSIDSSQHERESLSSTPTASISPNKYNLRPNTRMPAKLHNFQLNTRKSSPTTILKTYGAPRTFKSGGIAKVASNWEKTTPTSPATSAKPLDLQIDETKGLSKRSHRESLESNTSGKSTHYVVSELSTITISSQEKRAVCETPPPPQDARCCPANSIKHTILEKLVQKMGALVETQNKLLAKMPAQSTAISEASNEATASIHPSKSSTSPAKVSTYQWALNTFDFMLNQLTPATAEQAVGEVCDLLMAKMKDEQIKK